MSLNSWTVFFHARFWPFPPVLGRSSPQNPIVRRHNMQECPLRAYILKQLLVSPVCPVKKLSGLALGSLPKIPRVLPSFRTRVVRLLLIRTFYEDIVLLAVRMNCVKRMTRGVSSFFQLNWIAYTKNLSRVVLIAQGP